MKRSTVPASALAKLCELADAAEFLERRLVELDYAIAQARQRATGRFEQDGEHTELRAAIERMVSDREALRRRCGDAQTTYSACRRFLDGLGDSVELEPVNVQPPAGADLKDIRRQMRELQDQRKAIEQAPPPPAELEADVRSHVTALAAQGAPGARLLGATAVLPDGRRTAIAVTPPSDPLALLAWLAPDRVTAALQASLVECAGELQRLSRAERAERSAALAGEIEELAHVEESLIIAAQANGRTVTRSPGASPQAVLGVRIIKGAESRRAA